MNGCSTAPRATVGPVVRRATLALVGAVGRRRAAGGLGRAPRGVRRRRPRARRAGDRVVEATVDLVESLGAELARACDHRDGLRTGPSSALPNRSRPRRGDVPQAGRRHRQIHLLSTPRPEPARDRGRRRRGDEDPRCHPRGRGRCAGEAQAGDRWPRCHRDRRLSTMSPARRSTPSGSASPDGGRRRRPPRREPRSTGRRAGGRSASTRAGCP